MKPAGKSVHLGREELYELVWSEPMVRLAGRFAITNVGLAKTCRRMGIPVPPRGYWRRKEAGFQMDRPALPKLGPGMSTLAELRPRTLGENPPARSAEVLAQEAFEREPKNHIPVARRLTSPHPLVRHTRTVMGLAKPGGDGRLGVKRTTGLDIHVAPKNLGRALRIMNALLKALEARGFRISAGEGVTSVELLAERVTLVLEERVKCARHILTAAEERHPYGAPRWDCTPTGLLRLHIDEWTETTVRKTWTDSEKCPLDQLLNEVVLGLVIVADARRAERLEREREEQERAEAKRKALEAEERRHDEEERRRLLEKQASYWAKARQLRAFIDEVERRANVKGVSIVSGTELGEWIAWARRHADRLDPLKPPSDLDEEHRP